MDIRAGGVGGGEAEKFAVPVKFASGLQRVRFTVVTSVSPGRVVEPFSRDYVGHPLSGEESAAGTPCQGYNGVRTGRDFARFSVSR